MGEQESPARLLARCCPSLGEQESPARLLARRCPSLGEQESPARLLTRRCPSLPLSLLTQVEHPQARQLLHCLWKGI